MRSLPLAVGRALQVFTASKAFDERWVLGNPRLNHLGLHGLRVQLAYALNQRRRARLAAQLSASDRSAFDRDGFVVCPDFLSAAHFAQLLAQVRGHRTQMRERAEGSTLLRKIPVDRGVLEAVPALGPVLADARFRALLAYGEGNTSDPSVYLQTVKQKAVARAGSDPQCSLHRDTFHPTVKAWLYLTDVSPAVGPLRYVPGSHRLTPARLAWEQAKAVAAVAARSKESSFRISAPELAQLGYAEPSSLTVPANTLIVADTFGFHARAESQGPATRIELWAIGRRSPFLQFELDRAIQGLARSRRATRWQTREASAYMDDA
jgi:Phytanoyl-CoA dioxygenase (PhyH)